MSFCNKSLLTTNIAKVYLIIDGIYYVVDHVFGKYKHDRNMFIETKTNTRNL
jgi:hypothetical protein